MSEGMQGLTSLDFDPGEYAIEPSEWRRDADQQLSNLTPDSGEGGEALWHIHNIELSGGARVMEVLEDRRAMEGLETSGRQFLFRSPDGEPVMAYEREGFAIGTATTLRDLTSEAVLASWKASGLLGRLLRANWVLTDAGGDQRATAKRDWSLGALLYPTFAVTSVEGSDIGRFAAERDGLFTRMDIELEPSPIPPAVLLAMAYGILWATNQE
jgi:hypothetical protein